LGSVEKPHILKWHVTFFLNGLNSEILTQSRSDIVKIALITDLTEIFSAYKVYKTAISRFKLRIDAINND